MTNPEHVEWVKRAQKILGALLWLSTRTRPDIACAVSLAAQSLWHNLDHLKIRLRHLLQYLNTAKTFGLLYTFPQKEQPSTLSEFTVFADSSFAPSGKGSQTGYVILLSYGNVRHPEAELYALTVALQEEGDESAWPFAFYSAGDLLRRVLYALLTANIRLNLKN